jgi:hypothetical protein
VSRRIKAGHTGSRRDTDASARALREYEEIQRRREARHELNVAVDAMKDKGWRVTERGSE